MAYIDNPYATSDVMGNRGMMLSATPYTKVPGARLAPWVERRDVDAHGYRGTGITYGMELTPEQKAANAAAVRKQQNPYGWPAPEFIYKWTRNRRGYR